MKTKQRVFMFTSGVTHVLHTCACAFLWMLSVDISSRSAFYLVYREGLSLTWELTILATLASQLALGSPPLLRLPLAGIIAGLPCLPTFCIF